MDKEPNLNPVSEKGMGVLLIELNYSPLYWAILYKILEMADMETTNNCGMPIFMP